MVCFSCRFLQWSWRTMKERRLQSNNTLSWTDNASLWENKWGGLTKDISGSNLTVSLVFSVGFLQLQKKNQLLYLCYICYIFFVVEKHLLNITLCQEEKKKLFIYVLRYVRLVIFIFFYFIFLIKHALCAVSIFWPNGEYLANSICKKKNVKKKKLPI